MSGVCLCVLYLSFLSCFFFKLHSMYYYVLLLLLQVLLLLLLLFLISGVHYYPLVDSFSHFFFYLACTLWECCIISKKLYKPPLFPICSTEKKKGQ